MTPWDELPPSVRKDAERAQTLRTQNAELIKELEANGFPVEVTIARLEHFITKLAESGFISEADVHKWNVDWEQGLATQLQDIKAKAQQAKAVAFAAAEAEMRRRQLAGPAAGKPGLLGPSGQRISLPTKPE